MRPPERGRNPVLIPKSSSPKHTPGQLKLEPQLSSLCVIAELEGSAQSKIKRRRRKRRSDRSVARLTTAIPTISVRRSCTTCVSRLHTTSDRITAVCPLLVADDLSRSMSSSPCRRLDVYGCARITTDHRRTHGSPQRGADDGPVALGAPTASPPAPMRPWPGRPPHRC